MGFGGSRMLDHRHRRRMMLGTEPRTVATSRTQNSSNDESDCSAPPDLSLALSRVVPRAVWQAWGVGIFAGVGLLGSVVAWSITEQASLTGSMMADLIAPLTDRLRRGTGAAAWFLSAQLCLLVWWVRSRSRVDYAGRFHVWGWSAAGFLTASVLCLTDAHRLVAQLVAWPFVGASSNSTAVLAIWLLPSLVAGIVYWANLAEEFREHTASRWLHRLASVASLTAVASVLMQCRWPEELSWDGWICSSLAIMQWCHLTSVWMHLRHVVHVTVDPPQTDQTTSVTTAQGDLARIGNWFTRWRLGRSQSAAASTSPENSSKDTARRVFLESATETHEMRIDEAEPTAKGPSKHSRRSARR